MKHFTTLLYSLALVCLIVCIPQQAAAIGADPNPIKVRQPDGTSITIQLHGDEFLSWATCGNRLVAQGKDGFYYYASFDVAGIVQPSSTRVSGSAFAQPTSWQSTVRPPAVAIERAQRLRSLMASSQHRSDINHNRSNNSPMTKASSNSSGHKIVVLLASFRDNHFSLTRDNWDSFFNGDGCHELSGSYGSVKQYFSDNSSGQYVPEFDVFGPYMLSQNMAYYGGNQDGNKYVHVREMVVELLTMADPDVDFSQYDNDGNGYIDDVHVVFAGYDEAAGGSEDALWSHSWDTTPFNTTPLDGVLSGHYTVSPEFDSNSGARMKSIGVSCHELGHFIGLPDFYDIDYEENGQYYGIRQYSVMCTGCYNQNSTTPPYMTSMERNMLGWGTTFTPLTTGGSYSLAPVEENQAFTTPTANAGEFYLYEFRHLQGWDSGLPEPGLVIYHVDKSNNQVGDYTAAQRWSWGSGINAIGDHPCFDMISSQGYATPFPGQTNPLTSFTGTTSPSATDWAGNPTQYDLTNIAIAADQNSVSFDLAVPTTWHVTGTVCGKDNEPLQGALITLSAVEATSETSTHAAATAARSLNGQRFAPAASVRPAIQTPNASQISALAVTTWTAYTNADGTFSIPVPTGTYQLTATLTGYNLYMSPVFELSNNMSFPITLYSHVQSLNATLALYKSRTPANSWGTGEAGTFYCGVEFSPEQLAPYVGSTLQSIEFLTTGQQADKMGVSVYFYPDTVPEETTMESLKVYDYQFDPIFGSWVQVDISSASLTIPANQCMMLVYYIINASYGYPLAVDEGPRTTRNSTLLSYDGETWYYMNEEAGNLLLSANVLAANHTLYALGYNVIAMPTTTLAAGDVFTPSLDRFEALTNIEQPTSVQWFFDNQEVDAQNPITVTAGDHTLKAVLHYSSGKTDTIVQEIQVAQ